MNNQIIRRVLLGSACGVAMAGGLAGQPALAQSASAAKPAATSSEEVVVTGSRVAKTAFNSPTPVNTIDAGLVNKLAISNFSDALNQLPSFRPDTTPATNFFQARPVIAGRTMNLRGLGQQRTLVLVDGQRFVGSNDLGTLDLNEIPSSLIKRSEVVTGGASAAYGADAVAGVVNLIIDNTFTGMKADANIGRSERGDNDNYFLSFTAGNGFANDRGHVLVGMEYSEAKGLGPNACASRNWCSKYTNYIANPGFPANGLPATLVADDARFILNPAGVITSGPLKGTTFDKSGNPIPFNFGSFAGAVFEVGGDAPQGQLFAAQPLVAPDKHFAAMGRFDYELTDNLDASLTLNYAEAIGGPVGTTYWYDLGVLVPSIPNDNAYISATLKSQMAAAGVTSVTLKKYIGSAGPIEGYAKSDNKVYRAALQLKGNAWGDWRWDAGLQYGEHQGRMSARNIRDKARFAQAVDAVVAPNGQIVCRSTLANPGNGCIPINFFGEGNINPAALAWISKDAWQTRSYQLTTIEANLRGTLFEGWAGPIAGALGADYRHMRDSGTADANSVARTLNLILASPLPLTRQDVKEVYAEVNVPLITQAPLIDSLVIDGAVRQTSYSKFGNATTWKTGLVYRTSPDLMFRYTRSHDIREPNAQELNPLGTSQTVNLLDPVTNTNLLTTVITAGNPNLKLETAETETIGGVLTPRWFPNFQASLDHYDIDMGNVIDAVSAQNTLKFCTAGIAQSCGLIVRNGAGTVTSVTQTSQNLASLRAEGFEGSLNYSLDLDEMHAWVPGRLDIGLNANYVQKLYQITATGTKVQMRNATGNFGSAISISGVPRYRLNGYVSYSKDANTATFGWRYVPEALIDNSLIGPEQAGYSPTLANSISTNKVDSRFYVDLSASHKFNAGSKTKAEIYGSVANLFDVGQPSTLRSPYGNPLYFDPIGRAFKIGLRLQR